MPRYFFDIAFADASTTVEGADLPDDQAAQAFAEGLWSTLQRLESAVTSGTVAIRSGDTAIGSNPLPKLEENDRTKL